MNGNTKSVSRIGAQRWIGTVVLWLCLLASAPVYAEGGSEDSLSSRGVAQYTDTQERQVFYLKPSLKRGGIKNGVLSFSDDVFQMGLRERAYSTRNGARAAGGVDAFIGSLAASALVGYVASALSDDDSNAFWLWGGGYFVISFPWSYHQLASTIRPGLSVNFKGRWVDPEARGLVRLDGRWRDLEEDQWESALAEDTVEGYLEYLGKYPNGKRAKDAVERAESLAWQRAERRNTVEGYGEYLGVFSVGKHTNEAFERRESLAWSRAEGENSIQGYTEYLKMCSDHQRREEALTRIEFLAWEKADSLNTLAGYGEYRQECPNGKHVSLANERISEFDLAAWRDAEEIRTIPAYRQYLSVFPSGRFSGEANNRIMTELEGYAWIVTTTASIVDNWPYWDEFGLQRVLRREREAVRGTVEWS